MNNKIVVRFLRQIFLAKSELEYENFFIFSASYRSKSKEYRLVSARWKPCFIKEADNSTVQLRVVS